MSRIDIRSPLTLSDLVGALPGMCLLVGYCIALLSQRTYTVQVEQESAIYHKKTLQVPQPHADFEKPTTFIPFVLTIPEMKADGRATIITSVAGFTGRGRYTIAQEMKEVILPVIGDPPLLESKKEVFIPPQTSPYEAPLTPGTLYTEVSHKPNVQFHPTGTYEIKRSVIFEDASDKYAVVGGVIGSLISTMYVLWRLLGQPTKV
jgi:hypothetical protein